MKRVYMTSAIALILGGCASRQKPQHTSPIWAACFENPRPADLLFPQIFYCGGNGSCDVATAIVWQNPVVFALEGTWTRAAAVLEGVGPLTTELMPITIASHNIQITVVILAHIFPEEMMLKPRRLSIFVESKTPQQVAISTRVGTRGCRVIQLMPPPPLPSPAPPPPRQREERPEPRDSVRTI